MSLKGAHIYTGRFGLIALGCGLWVSWASFDSPALVCLEPWLWDPIYPGDTLLLISGLQEAN